MPDRVNWNPGPFRRSLDALFTRRSDQAGAIVRTRARLLAGRPGTSRLRGLPGEPPRRQTGKLVDSIVHLVGRTAERIYAAVGSPLDYAGYLSRGTPRMAARPFLTRALTELRDVLRALLIRGG